MQSKKRSPLVRKDSNIGLTPPPKKKTKKWGSEEKTPTGMLGIGRTLQLTTSQLKNSLQTLSTAAHAQQISANMFLSKVLDLKYIPIIRPPVKPVVQKAPKSGNKSNNANKIALSLEQIEIILHKAGKAAGCGEEAFDKVVENLGVMFDRTPRTINRIVKKYSKVKDDNKNTSLEIPKRGTSCKISGKGLKEYPHVRRRCVMAGEMVSSAWRRTC